MTKRPHNDTDPASTSIILDSLPYIDPVHEEYEQQATTLIQDELKSKASRCPLPASLPPIQHPALQQRYNELQQTDNNDAAPFSHTVEPPTQDDNTTLQEWKEAVQRGRLVYEAERLHSLELEAAQAEETILSKTYNTDTLLNIQQSIAQSLTGQQDAVDAVNALRVAHQVETLAKKPLLSTLQRAYQGQWQKLHSLKTATHNLERELGVEK